MGPGMGSSPSRPGGNGGGGVGEAVGVDLGMLGLYIPVMSSTRWVMNGAPRRMPTHLSVCRKVGAGVWSHKAGHRLVRPVVPGVGGRHKPGAAPCPVLPVHACPMFVNK